MTIGSVFPNKVGYSASLEASAEKGDTRNRPRWNEEILLRLMNRGPRQETACRTQGSAGVNGSRPRLERSLVGDHPAGESLPGRVAAELAAELGGIRYAEGSVGGWVAAGESVAKVEEHGDPHHGEVGTLSWVCWSRWNVDKAVSWAAAAVNGEVAVTVAAGTA